MLVRHIRPLDPNLGRSTQVGGYSAAEPGRESDPGLCLTCPKIENEARQCNHKNVVVVFCVWGKYKKNG